MMRLTISVLCRRHAFTFIGLMPWFASPAFAQAAGEAFVERIPGTLISVEMVPVPAGTVQLETPEGRRSVDVAPFWISKTEVPWDLYDIFVYGLDKAPIPAGADAISRPTRPYVLPGEEFGHEGHPAIGMTYHAAREFANWLSARTGRNYRVATEAEWEHACQLGRTEGLRSSGAWHRDNAEGRTHTVATLGADELGVHDLLGNVTEWVQGVDADSVVKGGSYDDAAESLTCSARRQQTPAWNATDPQLPKSRWWLPDATFVGLRIVRQP
jgi:formylglycine-generating enzyme required for sulfatase activity